MTDPIGAMVNEIKVGGLAKKPVITVKHSSIKSAILDCLKKAGFIDSFEKRVKQGHQVLDINISYSEDGTAKVKEAKRISKPSRRLYYGYRDIRLVKGGRGVIVLSTPKGILSGVDARKELVGGEPLFWIW